MPVITKCIGQIQSEAFSLESLSLDYFNIQTLKVTGCLYTIALFTVNSAHRHYNEIFHVCEAISGYFVVLARNYLASMLDYIVMQMRKTNREKGYWLQN